MFYIAGLYVISAPLFMGGKTLHYSFSLFWSQMYFHYLNNTKKNSSLLSFVLMFPLAKNKLFHKHDPLLGNNNMKSNSGLAYYQTGGICYALSEMLCHLRHVLETSNCYALCIVCLCNS